MGRETNLVFSLSKRPPKLQTQNSHTQKKTIQTPPETRNSSKLGRPGRLRALRHRGHRRGRLGAPRQGGRSLLVLAGLGGLAVAPPGAREAEEPEGVVRGPRPRRHQAPGQPKLLLLQARGAGTAAGQRRVDPRGARPLPAGREGARRRRPLGPLLELDPAAGGLPGERVLPGRRDPERGRGGREVQDDKDGEGAFRRRVRGKGAGGGGRREGGREGERERRRRREKRKSREKKRFSVPLFLSLSADARISFFEKASVLQRGGGLGVKGGGTVFFGKQKKRKEIEANTVLEKMIQQTSRGKNKGKGSTGLANTPLDPSK